MAWEGPVWTTVVAIEAILLLIAVVPFLIMNIIGVQTVLRLVVYGIYVVLVLAAGLLMFRHYRPVLGDRYTYYATTLEKVVDTFEGLFEEAGLEADRKEVPATRFAVEFHVRSEGLRVGLVKDYEGISVYVGPVKDFNKKVVAQIMYLSDRELWRPVSGYSIGDGLYS